MKARIRIRMGSNHAHYAGGLVDGAKMLELFGDVATELCMQLFSSPFDATAVVFLEQMKVPAYKIASFELIYLPLIRTVARTGKPIIMSTGMATIAETDDAVRAVRE